MTRLVLVTEIRAPAEACFDLSCDIDLHSRSMDASGERAVAGVTSGLIGLGEQVTWRARHFGIWWRMTSAVVEYERPARFVDEMRRGPFAAWRHEHRFEAHGDGTRMVDVADYRVPLGPLGRLVDTLVLRRYMRRLLVLRNTYIKRTAQGQAS
jgi:ligand-binding SRPBCC domain-containing protein